MKALLYGAAAFSLVSVSAFAGGLEPLPPSGPSALDWSGCYAGGHAGGGFGKTSATDTAGVLAPLTGFTSASVSMSGYTAGGQIGCDYQFAPTWLIGVEGAAGGASINGSSAFGVPAAMPGDVATFRDVTELLASATARVGYVFDRWLLYAKGGAAWAGNRYSAFDSMTTYDFEGLETRFGWTAGAGIEWAFWQDWSLRLEYDYYGFGTRSLTFIDNISGTNGPLEIKQNVQVVKLGLNFHVLTGAPARIPSGW